MRKLQAKNITIAIQIFLFVVVAAVDYSLSPLTYCRLCVCLEMVMERKSEIYANCVQSCSFLCFIDCQPSPSLSLSLNFFTCLMYLNLPSSSASILLFTFQCISKKGSRLRTNIARKRILFFRHFHSFTIAFSTSRRL